MGNFFRRLFGGADPAPPQSGDAAQEPEFVMGAIHTYWNPQSDDAASPPADPDFKAGALYSIFNGGEDGTFGVVKILVLDQSAVHIRVYQNTYPTRPAQVDESTLTLGSLSVEDLANDEVMANLESHKFGIGHMPIAWQDFVYGWEPVFLADSPVTDEELEGYNYWKQEGGGIWGGTG